MQNDKDDERYENSDESEYHFSDDDGSFDTLEPEVTETSVEEPVAQPQEKKPSILKLLNAQSKRMILSAAIFVGLVFIVYKMVAPTPQTISTTFTPVATTTTPPKQMADTAPTAQPQMAQPQTVMPVQPTVAANPPVNLPTAMPQQQAVSQPAQPAAPSTMPNMATAAQAPTTIAPNEMAAAQQNVPAQGLPAQPVTATSGNPMMEMQAAKAQPTPVNSQGANSGLPGMPAVIEVQAPAPTSNYAAGQMQQGAEASPTDQRIVDMQASNEKLMNELQSDYSQKINEFESQNKNLQDQVQALNTKISTLETQITQLVQALTQKSQMQQQAQATLPKNEPEAQAAEPQQAAPEHLAYNVQAIIPGRAWLRADSGDTVTVAEGDSVKNLGRVTKIDPYDGIVEINTGRKMVSLSYGSSG